MQNTYRILSDYRLCSFLLFSTACIAAEGTADTAEETQAVFWNFVIAVIVLATLIASAALPVAALRQWPGRWRYLAMFPLATLMLLLVVIVTAAWMTRGPTGCGHSNCSPGPWRT